LIFEVHIVWFVTLVSQSVRVMMRSFFDS
jgi:hypothetical protein